MEPPDTPLRETPPNAHCVSCEAPLEPDQRLRCLLCQQAARIAVEEAGGQVVKASDVARVRKWLG
jgi:hypothetical protein